MNFMKCPGSSAVSRPKPQIVACPQCGGEVEIWSDEAQGRCVACRLIVTRSGMQSCLDWCAHARECVGEEKYRKHCEERKVSGES